MQWRRFLQVFNCILNLTERFSNFFKKRVKRKIINDIKTSSKKYLAPKFQEEQPPMDPRPVYTGPPDWSASKTHPLNDLTRTSHDQRHGQMEV